MSEKAKITGKRLAIIVPVPNEGHVGFILSLLNSNYAVYWNSRCSNYDAIQSRLQSEFPDVKIKQFDKNDSPDFSLWAKKIALINKGIDQDTSMITLDLSGYTPKQKQVIEVSHQQLAVNEFVSYGQVAELAGLPNAHRFVGTTMRLCRQPWIIPCQRIKNSQFIKKLSRKKIIRSMPI